MMSTSPSQLVAAVEPGALLSLACECERTAVNELACTAVVRRRAAALLARVESSSQHARAQRSACRTALLSRKARVVAAAKRRVLKAAKALVAAADAAAVSAEQLHD